MIALRDQIDLSSRSLRRSSASEVASKLVAERSRLSTHRADAADAITTHIASEGRDLYAALRLVYQAYIETGLIEPNPYELRATRYHLLPTTNVFIAMQREQMLGTLTLVRDGEFGLPMEDVYAGEVAARRARGVTLAEVSCLADDGHGKTSMLAVVIQLMSHMAQFAARQGVDELLIAVHPHHVGFYERFTGFEVIGDQKSYSAVRNHPAVALALDLKHGEINHPRAYQRFFGKPLPASELESAGFNDATLAELHWIVELTNSMNSHPRRRLKASAAA